MWGNPFQKGHIPWNKGKNYIPWNAGIKGKENSQIGKNNPFYKHGLYSEFSPHPDRNKILAQRKKEWRNRTGKNKYSLRETIGLELVQRVYEDNIKKYGTLTCYLCLKEVAFGNDHLEHRIPLSRGGNNLYENLAVACARCNLSKNNKTEEEYRERVGL